MKAGIIAAGHGTRFSEAGWGMPKPLVPVNGRHLIDHVLQSLLESGRVDQIGVLLNGEEGADLVEDHVRQGEYSSKVTVWRRTTASSYESFRYVCRRLGDTPFVISTVDTLFDPSELRGFLDLGLYQPRYELVLGVTDFVHDEKPLWVSQDRVGTVVSLGDEVPDKQLVTAGLYLVLRPLRELECQDFSALRECLKCVVASGRSVFGSRLTRAIDVDTPEDVRLAEDFMRAE